ncbi:MULTISPECIES: [protein-PII] uridylyltransferase [unclassified Acinetobacter]|uniref:[protein-PII] uridylyltransferase n=1 Tax=unclassified Acinetobacter TaxID=196816 RepID=UPI0035B7E039
MSIHSISLQNYADLSQNLSVLNTWRNDLEKQLDDNLAEKNITIRESLLFRSQQIDQALIFLWQHVGLAHQNVSLFAVGGYGRKEMLPYSDVDLLILYENEIDNETEQKISQFISHLWDVGHFKPAVSVRNLAECFQQAEADITIATSLIEARFICGLETLKTWPKKIVFSTWKDLSFFEAKMQEQQQRHAQYHNTESYLEPDIKNSPGGLRDLHQIGWIAKLHFRVQRIYDLVHLGFITNNELNRLEQAEDFLWTVRHHLHRLKQRDDNRLLFDYQREIASRMGYIQQDGDAPNQQIEQFMRKYYRTAQTVATLNELLLSYFFEAVITPRVQDYQREIIEINQNFKLVDNKLAVQHHKVFAENPSAILELFVLMANHPEIEGIRARTLRLLIIAANSIDDNFRNNSEHKALFIQIMQHPERLYKILSLMHRYGVLSKYIPAFAKITGLMQYDLFHIYTVDAHTLKLLKHLKRFGDADFGQQFPVVSNVYQRIKRKDLLCITALFHDIAKGRDGDHCDLGAIDVLAFCREHGLPERECKFVSWLVQYHLHMSLTAQKKDISDPDVVQQFAELMGDMEHLDHLYCLTVADINSTNPKLWNNWKASLLRQLYSSAREVIRSGVDRPVDHQSLIEDTKFAAMDVLADEFSHHDIEKLWQDLGDDYLLKENVDEIIWHTRAILQHENKSEPLVLIREQRKTLQLFIYSPDQKNLFATTVAWLDRLNLDVQDARIITANTQFSLDTYIVQDRLNSLASDPERQQQVIDTLRKALSEQHYPQACQRRMPRQLKHFCMDSQVNLRFNSALHQYMVEIITLDCPGLLAKIGEFFMQQGLEIHSAKIATLGERAEDIFYVTKPEQQLFDEQESRALVKNLKQLLNQFTGHDG